jgi:hypothetical protein
LVAAAAGALNTDRNGVLSWFGRMAIPVLAELYPEFFTPHRSAWPFVRGVNDIIHAEVRKLYPGAGCPQLPIREAPDGALIMDYHSSRRLCALAQGFVEGAAAYYGEAVVFEHLTCVDAGDQGCSFRIAWIGQSEQSHAA